MRETSRQHQRIRPYAPRDNGKVERHDRLLADDVLYPRSYPSEQARRDAITVWVNHFTYHRPHTDCGDQPRASRTPTHVNNVTHCYT